MYYVDLNEPTTTADNIRVRLSYNSIGIQDILSLYKPHYFIIEMHFLAAPGHPLS